MARFDINNVNEVAPKGGWENSKKIIVFYSEDNTEIPAILQHTRLYSNITELEYTRNLLDGLIDKANFKCGFVILEFYPKESKRRFIIDMFTGEKSHYVIGEICAKIINNERCDAELMDFVNKEIIRLGIDKGEFNGKASN